MAWLMVAAGCWGLDTTLSSYALRRLTAADLFALETVVGAVALWTYVFLRRGFRRPAKLLPHIALGAIEPGFAYLLFDLGLRRTSAVSGGLLLSTETLLGVLLAVVLLRERLTRAGVVSLVLGLAGTLLIPLGESAHGDTAFGDLIVVAAAATSASYFLVARKFRDHEDTLSGTGVQLLTAAAIALGYAAITWSTSGSGIGTAPVGYLAVGVATGVVGIAAPFYLLNRALGDVPASYAALTLNLTPVFAVGTAVALLMEGLHGTSLAGGALILVAITVLGLTPDPSRSPSGPAP